MTSKHLFIQTSKFLWSGNLMRTYFAKNRRYFRITFLLKDYQFY